MLLILPQGGQQMTMNRFKSAMTRKSGYHIMTAILAGLVCSLSACDSTSTTTTISGNPTPQQVAEMPTEPNITRVAAVFNPITAWVWTPDKTRVRGLWISGVYLIGPDGRSHFGDGTLMPRIYVLTENEEGKKVPELLKEWEYDVEAAIPFRSKRPKAWGWGYGLPLMWDEEDIGGKEIRVLIRFRRSDGLMVSASARDVRVPVGN
jgi:hypothetical protein